MALLAMLILAPGAFAQDPPVPPTDLEARPGAVDQETGDQHGRITLSWPPVAAVGGFDVTDYVIEFSSDYDVADPTTATWTVVDITETAPADPAAADAKYTAVHILPEEADGDTETASYNLTRHYRVKAVNIFGEGGPSNVAMATTHNVPDPPTDLTADATDDTPSSITATWNAVTVPEGALAVTSYILEVTDDLTDDDSWTASDADLADVGGGTIAVTAPADPPTDTEYSAVHTLAATDDGVTRYYRVKAVNAAGTGGPSGVDPATTHDVPSVPTGLTTGAVAVNADNADQNDIPVSWNASANDGGLPITGYQLQFLLDPPGSAWAQVGDRNVTGTDTTHAGLAENVTTPETYYYRVRAINAASPAAASDADGDEWSVVTAGVKLALPGAPTMLQAIAVDQRDAINLFWEAPETDGEPAATRYRIERAPDDTGTPGNPGTYVDLQASYEGMAYADRDAEHGMRFHYRVSAINVVGQTPEADASVVSVVSSNKALMPRNLVATVADDMESIVLTWDGPVADGDGNPANGGSMITGYKIEVSTDAGTTWADVVEDMPEHPEAGLLTSTPGSEYRYPHSTVAEGTTYTYRVSAVNDAGPGHVSASSNSASIDAVLPGMPTDLTATADMDAPSITLMWAAPADRTGAQTLPSWKIDSL